MTVDHAIHLMLCHKAEQRARARPRCRGSRRPELSHHEMIDKFLEKLDKSPVAGMVIRPAPE